MKSRIGTGPVQIAGILLLAALLLPFQAGAQKKIYTRSYMLQDFKSKTTKVVLGGDSRLNAALRRDVTSFWILSPYEFCSVAEYEKQKNSPDCYFLYPEISKGIVFLTLARGGKEDDPSAFKRPLMVGSVPVCGENDDTGSVNVYMPAYLTMIQDFVEVALDSEMKAYRGLSALARHAPRDTKVHTDPEEAAEAFRKMEPNGAVSIFITPDGNPASKPRYKLVFSTDGYELYFYGKR